MNMTPTMTSKFSWKNPSSAGTPKSAEKRRKARPDVEQEGNGPLPEVQHGRNIPKLGKETQGSEPDEEAAQRGEKDGEEGVEEGEIKEDETVSATATASASASVSDDAVDSDNDKDVSTSPQKNDDEQEGNLRRSLRKRSESDPAGSDQSPATPPVEKTEKRTRTLPSTTHQCERCGKVYKHKNCLLKHAWEHHESWSLTKKWCATKHQQVQMLEAAQVLVEMTTTGHGPIRGGDKQHSYVLIAQPRPLYRLGSTSPPA